MQNRRNYTDDYKRAAVRRWREPGNFNEVARELEIAHMILESLSSGSGKFVETRTRELFFCWSKL